MLDNSFATICRISLEPAFQPDNGSSGQPKAYNTPAIDNYAESIGKDNDNTVANPARCSYFPKSGRNLVARRLETVKMRHTKPQHITVQSKSNESSGSPWKNLFKIDPLREFFAQSEKS